MKKQRLKVVISAGLISLGMVASVDAALVSRLGGLAYYDTNADLTWLADANHAQTSGFDADGLMTWQNANAWAAQLTVGGVSGWRLPDTLQPDASCSIQAGGISEGSNCMGSEMGNLFYNVLGNSANASFINGEPFSEVQPGFYWSATELASGDTSRAWLFSMGNGRQNFGLKTNDRNAWAVQSGDVSAVPVPAAVWLFGSGLLGLIGVARRKSANN